MNSVWQFLLGVKRIEFGSGHIEFSFLSAWPAWAAFLSLVAAALYVWSIYRREAPNVSPLSRGLLVFLRFFVILLVLGMIFEPVLVLLRNETIRSSIVVMVNRSASMSVVDTPENAEQQRALEALLAKGQIKVADKEGRPSRYELVRAALRADGGATLRKLAAEQRVLLCGFDEAPQQPQHIDAPEAVDEALKQCDAAAPTGQRTAVVESLEKVLEQLAGQTVTGVVVLTDGRSTVKKDLKRLEETAKVRDLRFYAVAVGDVKPPRDAEVRRVIAERRGFVNEDIPVRVELVNKGFAGKPAELQLEVKGHPEMNVTQTVTLGDEGRPQIVELHFKPAKAEKHELTARLKPLPGEFDEANNVSLPFEINVIDRKLKVLLVEDAPRWEYHYLKNALSRDPTLLVSVVLNRADPDFPPEGSLPIAGFPSAREALFAYDVIIIGDVSKRSLTSDQMKWIKEFVSEKGGGVVFIAGGESPQNPNGGNNPKGYVGTAGAPNTPLGDLLPIEPSDEQITGDLTTSFHPEFTIEGSVSPILRFEKDLSANAEVWRNLPGFFWYSRAKVKPGATVLLVHPEDKNPGGDGEKFPIMVIQRVGAGQVFYCATDETWRWRYYTGRRYFNTFWIQLLRYLALHQDDATIEASSLRYTLGDPAKLQYRVADLNNVPENLLQVKATVTYTVPGELKERTGEVVLTRPNAKRSVFEGVFTPECTGKFTVEAKLVGKDGKEIKATSDFLVAPSREEFEDSTRDEDFLNKLVAVAPGNRKLEVTQFAELPGQIASRNRTVRNDLTDEIWDSPLALILLIGALTGEWILRKRHRML